MGGEEMHHCFFFFFLVAGANYVCSIVNGHGRTGDTRNRGLEGLYND